MANPTASEFKELGDLLLDTLQAACDKLAARIKVLKRPTSSSGSRRSNPSRLSAPTWASRSRAWTARANSSRRAAASGMRGRRRTPNRAKPRLKMLRATRRQTWRRWEGSPLQLMRPDSPTFSLSKPCWSSSRSWRWYFRQCQAVEHDQILLDCAATYDGPPDGVADAVQGSDGPPPVQIRRGNRPSRRPPRFSNASGIASTGTRNDGRRVRLSGLPADCTFSPRRSNSFSPRATWRRRDGASVVENADEHKPARRRLTAAASGKNPHGLRAPRCEAREAHGRSDGSTDVGSPRRRCGRRPRPSRSAATANPND